ncbi:PAS domain S-box protein [Flavobacterium phycosphaerae]|uniref:PAS domain S-box protein n=1 Tax=Flavobacterium phycosphaerae TaxID=2697515 RepID=UPI0013895130|nr:PAS domain S-box protein [Flavobacterium phycosphaerae]
MIGKKALFEFFKISPTPSLVLSPDAPKFTIVDVNEAYLEATNSKSSDLIGKGIFEAFPDNDNDPKADGVKNLSQSLQTVIKTKLKHKMDIQKYDIPIRGTSAFEIKYWEPENIPLLNDDGQLKFIIHTVRDITEKITAQKQIKEFEYFFNNSNDFSCIANTDGYFEITNCSFNKILGYSENELIAKPFIDFVHPDDIDNTMEAYSQLKSGATVIHFFNRYRKKNGEYIWLDWNATPNNVTGKLYCIARDFTERKKAEEALKLLNEELEQRVQERTSDVEKALKRFEYVTKATFDAIWDWNLIEDKIYWGDGIEKIFGYKLSELKDESIAWTQNIHPEDIKKITASYYATVKSNKTNWIEEYRYKKSNGQYAYVINKGIVIRDTKGKAIRIIGAMQDITKRKEEELRLKLLESVITNTNDAVVIKEAKPSKNGGRKIVYVNESFTRMSGYTQEEIIGKTHKILQGPNTDSKELERFYKSLDEWKPCEVTIINYTKTGEEYWVQLSLNPVTNAEGEYTHWISIERDVTEKKIVEEELLKRLKEISDYKYAIDESSIVAITNQKGIITHVNDNFCKISKYDREELLGQDHRIINSGYHPKEFIKRLWTTIAKGKVWKGELKNKAKDGSPYWVDTTIVPFLNEDGKPYQYVAIRSDITERKNQEQKIIETTQLLSETLESIQDGFYTLDNQWNITYWNKEAERISGKTKDEMIGRNFWELYEGRISEKIHTAFYKAKAQNKPIRIEVYSKITRNWFELNAFPSIMGLTIYFKNITERKKTESKLKKINRSLENHVKELAISNQELEQFAYVASHDLQEPLRMVTSFLSQIEKKYEDVLDDKGKKYIFFAVDGAKRMRQIILDLLEFSRIGKYETKLEEVDLNSVVEEIKLLYYQQIEEKKATVNNEVLPKIRTHSAPIKQVFQNLISNGLKYSAPGINPIITISCQETNTAWRFEIKDNGIGINKEYFTKIFIIFQRLHNKEEYSGTGMGLAITKKIIENLRGHVWLESEEGKGTSFFFTIPKK